MKVPITSLDNKTLLSLRPNESIFMISNLLKYLINEKEYSLEKASNKVSEGISGSEFNIRKKGIASILNKINLKPVLFVPESAHYSFKKAANILGYGEDAIRTIPIGADFRIDVAKLESMINGMAVDEYIVAVVAVVGTTEEGAVDPVHRIKWMRDRLGEEKNLSFWLHVDAAWGGYIRSLFCDEFDEINAIDDSTDSEEAFKRKIDYMINKINATDTYTEAAGKGTRKRITVTWQQREVYAAFMAMRAADSVTIDPHKLGYVPYPAGLIAFKNKYVTQLVAQDASYISTSNSSIAQIDLPPITGVGSFILEGSKPGAAALSCWLAATMIPLDQHHHGKIMKTTLLNAQRLAQYLKRHKAKLFDQIDKEFDDCKIFPTTSKRPFYFNLLYNNIDTNVICFVVIPARWSKANPNKNEMELDNWTLERVNKLNKLIYDRFTINPKTKDDERKVTIAQRFYISHTELKKESYAYASIKSTLMSMGFTEREYDRFGLFVMRSTVMNPWYFLAANGSSKADSRMDYFMEFIRELHYQSRIVIESFNES